MSPSTTGRTWAIDEPFNKAVLMVRRVLTDAGLSVVDEFDLSDEPYFRLGIGKRSCVVLLVDTPMTVVRSHRSRSRGGRLSSGSCGHQRQSRYGVRSLVESDRGLWFATPGAGESSLGEPVCPRH